MKKRKNNRAIMIIMVYHGIFSNKFATNGQMGEEGAYNFQQMGGEGAYNYVQKSI